MYRYSPENARIYGQLGILGTTYEASFNEVGRLLGNFQGQTALDFGAGTGRSTRFIKTLGAEKVIGVDHDKHMLEQALAQAKANQEEGIEFHLMTDNTIPLSDGSIDVAISTHVFIEIRTLEDMQQVAKEIARVLKPHGTCIVVANNPDSIGCQYKSYTYKKQEGLKSGDPITCVVKGETASFEIQDTYWTEEDYRQVLASAGFIKVQTIFPLAEGEEWLEETKVAPDMIVFCIKGQTEKAGEGTSTC